MPSTTHDVYLKDMRLADLLTDAGPIEPEYRDDEEDEEEFLFVAPRRGARELDLTLAVAPGGAFTKLDRFDIEKCGKGVSVYFIFLCTFVLRGIG